MNTTFPTLTTEEAAKLPDFRTELEQLINKHCLENLCNTPDTILAEVMVQALVQFKWVTESRERWYGVKLSPGNSRCRNCTEAQGLVKV